MAINIDWHSHHTAPEVSERIKDITGKRPHIDALDSPDFSKRIREMDEAGVDLQLICQGAGVYADQMPPEHASTFEHMMARPLALDRALLKDGEVVTDARNRALHDVAKGQLIYRRAVVESLPAAFLVN